MFLSPLCRWWQFLQMLAKAFTIQVLQLQWNKRPMGNIAHLRHSVVTHSNNTFVQCYNNDYTITYVDWEKQVILFMIMELLEKREFSSFKDALCKIWLKLAHRFWRRRFLISSMYFSYFVIISPWLKVFFSFEQIWIIFIQGCFVSSLVEIGPVILEKNVFSLFRYYPSLEKDMMALLLKEVESPLPKDALC